MSTKAKVITAVVSILVIGTIAYFMYQAGKKAGKKALEAEAAKSALEAAKSAEFTMTSTEPAEVKEAA